MKRDGERRDEPVSEQETEGEKKISFCQAVNDGQVFSRCRRGASVASAPGCSGRQKEKRKINKEREKGKEKRCISCTGQG